MKIILIFFIILVSLLLSLFCDQVYIEESFIFNCILNILAVSFAAYSFLYTPLANIINKNKVNSDGLTKLLKQLLRGLAENITFIFFSLLTLLFLNVFYKADIPFLSDLHNFRIYNLEFYSLKELIYKFFKYDIFLLCFYAFYDIMQATFKIFTDCFDISKDK